MALAMYSVPVFGAGAADAINEKSSIGFDISRYQFGSRTHEPFHADGTSTDYYFKLSDNLTTVNISYNVSF